MTRLEINAIETKANKNNILTQVKVTGIDLDSLRNLTGEAKEITITFNLEEDYDYNKFLKIFWSKSIRKNAKNLNQALDQAVKDNAIIYIYDKEDKPR
ncbi:MAG: hypothetical protein K6F34_11420 [Lachnospiraceae bacterium]|nr:hypothetical protein [Lachnospiraceae bacterium]